MLFVILDWYWRNVVKFVDCQYFFENWDGFVVVGQYEDFGFVVKVYMVEIVCQCGQKFGGFGIVFVIDWYDDCDGCIVWFGWCFGCVGQKVCDY